MKLKYLDHGMLLDSKRIMDDAMSVLEDLQKLVPERLHDELDRIIRLFEHELVECDVSERYTEVE